MGDARGDVPRPSLPRHRLGRVAQRVAARRRLARARRPGRAHGGGARDHPRACSTASASTTTGRTSAPRERRAAHACPSAARRSTSPPSAPRPPASRRASATGSGRSADPESAPEVIDAYRVGVRRRRPRARRDRPPGAVLVGERRGRGARGRPRLEGRAAGRVLHRRLARPRGDVRARREAGLRRRAARGADHLVRPRASTSSASARSRSSAPTTVALMNVSGADPHAAIETYAERVLPALAPVRS